jgi:hypothetical protein
MLDQLLHMYASWRAGCKCHILNTLVFHHADGILLLLFKMVNDVRDNLHCLPALPFDEPPASHSYIT